MKKYKLASNKEITIPEGWNEINVNQLIRMQKCTGNTIAAQNELIKILTDADADDISFDDYLNLAMAITTALQQPMNKLLKKTVEYDGVKYVAKELKEFSAKEFVDFDTIACANDNEQMPLLLGIIYTRVNDDRDYAVAVKENAKLFGEKMDAETALAAITFFSDALLLFVKNMVDSSPAARKMMEKNQTAMNQLKMIENYLYLAGAGN